MKTFSETLYDSYGQVFRVDELLFERKTDHQHLVIFHNAAFGRVLALDGVVQTTEKDEFIYHEMLAHVPIFAHGSVKRVLIVGGGDGGMLREVTQHRSMTKVTQVEIDREVIDLSCKYLPNHSNGAFDHPGVEIIIDDGFNYVSQTKDTFDIIISDSTDPIGPGEVLFTSEYYKACQRCLKPGGILVTQNGVAFMQPDEVQSTAHHFSEIFNDWHFYHAAIPTYIGGLMAFGWATDEPAYRYTPLRILKQRYHQSGVRTRYYNPEIHRAAFMLPQYLLTAIGKKTNGPDSNITF